MTLRQLEIVQHSLGVDEHGRTPKGYTPFTRNYFCAGGDDVTVCRELVELGYAESFERQYLPYFNITITRAGIDAMKSESPKPPVLTRPQQNYREFLEADTGYSFREWLSRPREGECL